MQEFFINAIYFVIYSMGIATSLFVAAVAVFFTFLWFRFVAYNFAMLIGSDIPEDVNELAEEFRKNLLETK